MPQKQKKITKTDLGKIVIYQSGKVPEVQVRIVGETLWLTQAQVAELFGAERSVITKHIRNILTSKELDDKSVCAKFAHTAEDGKQYQVKYYNLDLIIAVGYRTNSRQATLFRIWATKVLREHILKGYTLNRRLLEKQQNRFEELKTAIALLHRTVHNYEISSNEARGIADIIREYTRALDILDQYDHQKLGINDTSSSTATALTYDQAISVIKQLKTQFSATDFFGKEKDQSFRSTMGAIYQSFNGKDLYPSIEEKAAHLLYFAVKNHSFIDGNKRIAAFLFIWFLQHNGALYHPDGSKRIADNALVALCLMTAESKPEEKKIIIKVIINLINRTN
jgi:prophage maintenance system killer protein